LEAALEEWRTGTFVAHALSSHHETRYSFHLRRLLKLQDALPNRCKNLMNFIAEDALWVPSSCTEALLLMSLSFDDMQVAPAQETEDDQFEMYGADSEDDPDEA
jgi:hypothetical protein